MEKMKLSTADLVSDNIEKIAKAFPNCITESRTEAGEVVRAVDFDLLRQELSASIVEAAAERYRLDWPGKRNSILAANAPIAKTLRPCEEESVDFDKTQNIYIEGDNLDALKLLQETYLGKVKMIYIDPPYNTGKDFIYKDNFAADKQQYFKDSMQTDEEGNRLEANLESNGRYHSDWLSMMYPRLKLARNLLKDNGLIFVSIDDNEVHNLRKMCDEIFGEDNFVANIIWQKKTSPDARMEISPAHDHLIVYCKIIGLLKLNPLPLDDTRIRNYKNPDNDPRGPWASVDLTGQTGRAPKSQFYKIKTPLGTEMSAPEGRCWALAEYTFESLLKDNRIWFGNDGSNRPRLKKFLCEAEGTRPWTWWDNKTVGHNQEGNQEVKKIFEDKLVFDNPKPVRLLQRIIQLSTNSDDLILDFFAGSSTMAHAVILQNSIDKFKRKFILVQIPEEVLTGSNDYKSDSVAYQLGYKTIADIGKERIRRVGKKIVEEMNAEQVKKSEKCGKEKTGLFDGAGDKDNQPNPEKGSDLDIGFRVFKVDSSNMQDVYYSPDSLSKKDLFRDNIKPDRTSLDLLFQVLLDWGIELSAPVEQKTICGKEVFFVGVNSLAACFDSDITDEATKQIAKTKPLRAVFRDNSFKTDSAKINVEQIFKALSAGTEVKTI